MAKAKVYVSSTYLDLQECREKVRVLLRQLDYEDVAMEYYVAEDKRPVEKCLEDVASCELYIGLFAWRYGWVPTRQNRKKLSITEMEFRQAVRAGKTCLIFLLDGKTSWPPDFIDDDKTRIKKLREELSEQHGASLFTSPDNLSSLVSAALTKWERAQGIGPAPPSIPELDLAPYYAALARRYRHLDLDALTPPQRDENLRQRLREVFVEQNVRENPPPVELPKEVWDKLRRESEIHADDLPSGVTPEDVLRARESYFEKPSRPVLEVITDARRRHSIVLGDPGSGKSTLARFVLLSLIDDAGDEHLRRAFEGHLPLMIELRSFVGFYTRNKSITFLEYLDALGKNEGWQLDAAALKHYLDTDGRAVVIFDGLDEIFDPECREDFARRIAGFAASHPNARVIVTSRVIGYRRKILTDAGFDHFTLQDLDERQVSTFIDRWYALVLDERPDDARARRERIMRSFKESASIRQLAGNPMLLTIMAIIGKNQELPRERWKLYDHAAAVLIHHWDVERHLENKNIKAPFIGEEEKKELLRRLAYKMQGSEGGLSGNHIHRADLQAEFESYLRERFNQTPAEATTIARAMIDQFRSRNFILSLYGANLYGFVHRAFLEFFCATAIVNKFEKTQELTLEDLKQNVYGAHWEDRTWHEVLRLICGMIDEKFAGEIIDYLAHSLYQPWPEDFSTRPPWNVALAVQCLSEVRNISLIETAAEKLLHTCCRLFGRLFETKKLELVLAEFLEDVLVPSAKAIGSEWPGRGQLAASFEHFFNPRLNYDIYIYKARSSGAFIGSVGSGLPQVREYLCALMEGENDMIQCFCAHALSEFCRGQRENLELLIHYVKKSSSSISRSYALSYLAHLWPAEKEVLLLLRDHAINDTVPATRVDSIELLVTHFREDDTILPLLQDRAVNDPFPSAGDTSLADNVSVRFTAINLIAEHWPQHPDTVPLLRERANNDPTPPVRDWARKLLAELERNEARGEDDAV